MSIPDTEPKPHEYTDALHVLKICMESDDTNVIMMLQQRIISLSDDLKRQYGFIIVDGLLEQRRSKDLPNIFEQNDVPSDAVALADLCKSTRESKNLTIDQLAKAAKVSNHSIKGIENIGNGPTSSRPLFEALRSSRGGVLEVWIEVIKKITNVLEVDAGPWLDLLQKLRAVCLQAS